jgi:hypothetical protein
VVPAEDARAPPTTNRPRSPGAVTRASTRRAPNQTASASRQVGGPKAGPLHQPVIPVLVPRTGTSLRAGRDQRDALQRWPRRANWSDGCPTGGTRRRSRTGGRRLARAGTTSTRPPTTLQDPAPRPDRSAARSTGHLPGRPRGAGPGDSCSTRPRQALGRRSVADDVVDDRRDPLLGRDRAEPVAAQGTAEFALGGIVHRRDDRSVWR